MDKKIIESCLKEFFIGDKKYNYYDINELEKYGYEISTLPFAIKILLENALRNFDEKKICLEHVENVASWTKADPTDDFAFVPARILLQDFTGVPAVVDLAAMRESVNKAGLDASLINPVSKVDLVIDHSLIIDYFGDEDAINKNIAKEYERNLERYKFLKWAKNSFDNFAVYEPGLGIIHQINLEKIATCVQEKDGFAFPDTLIGTDSHTTMINGLSVFGFGVGGIEAESAMLSQPIYMTRPEVIGVEIIGKARDGVFATDVVLTLVELLRRENVVGKIVEYFGEGIDEMEVPDRATIANMAPEYGATAGIFSVDEKTVDYLRLTGRESAADLTKAYYESIGVFASETKLKYTKVLKLDLSEVKSSMAGHKRPQDRIELSALKSAFKKSVISKPKEGGLGLAESDLDKKLLYKFDEKDYALKSGDVVMASITSCTNTSNPQVLIGAALIAKKASDLGLKVPKHVKTSFAPGSRAVTNYLEKAGLLKYLEALGFNVVGYGCATCIGNGGLLLDGIEEALAKDEIPVASVVSGNRNFEGRIHQKIKTNYLASPMLVMIFALKGNINTNIEKESIGISKDGKEVFLKDLWPSNSEINEIAKKVITKDAFEVIDNPFADRFNSIEVDSSKLYKWEKDSTYIRLPDFFDGVAERAKELGNIENLTLLAAFGDSVTTDHISPAGAISKKSPAGKYLLEKGIDVKDFNSYGSRRGNHEVMMRGAFANIRIRNLLVKDVEGGYTLDEKGDILSIYDRAMQLKEFGTAAIVIAGKEYGTGSSRDWAAKGPALLGVKVIIARSYERIHRSNLIGMGILPLEFLKGDSYESLELKNYSKYSIIGLNDKIKAGALLLVKAQGNDLEKTFNVRLRLDSEVEKLYYKNGGILHTLIKEMI